MNRREYFARVLIGSSTFLMGINDLVLSESETEGEKKNDERIKESFSLTQTL